MKLSIVFVITSEIDYAHMVQAIDKIKYALNTEEYEIIIISDIDMSFDLFKNISNINITINKKPIGIFESRRKSIKLAKGKYISFVDPNFYLYVSDLQFLEDAEFDIIKFGIKLQYDTNEYILERYILDENEANEYVNLNPITSRFILKKCYDPFMNNYMFKTKYIKDFYKKIPTIDNYNKLFDIYLIFALMKYMTSFKYDFHIFGITTFDKSFKPSPDKKINKLFYGLDPDSYFDKNEYKELEAFLENDELNISKDVLNYINSFTGNNE